MANIGDIVFVIPATGLSVPNMDMGTSVYFDPAGENIVLSNNVQRQIDSGDLIFGTPSGPAWQSFVMSEGPGTLSRDTITVASGAGVLKAGSVIGKVTATSKWKSSVKPPGATDGSETAKGILLYPVDATSVDVVTTALTNNAEVLGSILTYDATCTVQADKDAKNASLLLAVIKVR